MTYYPAIVFVHVLSAIVAVGCNATYAIWLVRGDREPEHLLFALRGIRFIDTFVANPAYALLLITGIGQVILSHRSWNEPWIAYALGLYALLVAIAIGAYSPGLKRQIAVLEEKGPTSPAYVAIASRQRAVGIVLMVVALLILAMMVFRPGGA